MNVIIIGGNFDSYYILWRQLLLLYFHYGDNFGSLYFNYGGKLGFLISLYITMLLLHAFIILYSNNIMFLIYYFQTYHENLTSHKAYKNISHYTTL